MGGVQIGAGVVVGFFLSLAFEASGDSGVGRRLNRRNVRSVPTHSLGSADSPVVFLVRPSPSDAHPVRSPRHRALQPLPGWGAISPARSWPSCTGGRGLADTAAMIDAAWPTCGFFSVVELFESCLCGECRCA